MTEVAELASGKGARDENFPVASFLLKPRYREPIMTFYRFARAADDIADHPDASPEKKLEMLQAMRRGLDGFEDGAAEALALWAVLTERNLDPVHAHDLLSAFEQDATVHRYASWADLMAYCRLSAMPVGRFVLDVHGEDRRCWPASDALCAALQVINHLQDCGKDYRMLDRVYLPTEALAVAGGRVEDLAGGSASPGLAKTLNSLTRSTLDLLRESAAFASMIRDRRLAIEVAVIQRLAERLSHRLLKRDPLRQKVHHSKVEALLIGTTAALSYLFLPAPSHVRR